jgi:hypothetical protein
MPPGFRQPQFTEYSVQPIGNEKLHVWVEENLAEHAPNETTLNNLRRRLSRAIETEREIFGVQPTPPSQDRDIHMIIAAIPPYQKNGKNYGFDGFFNVYDQLTEEKAQQYGQHSNARNIIYLNALQDLASAYMQGVAAHELNHLITFAQNDPDKNPLDTWLNEMLGEAAMQITGYYTDTTHVQNYRAHPEWPVAIEGYGLSYGAESLFAEYLMTHFDVKMIGRLAPSQGNGFERISHVYQKSWNEIFEGYIHWLMEQNPSSRFEAGSIAARAPSNEIKLPPTAVTYITGTPFNAAQEFKITAAPPACTSSTNMIRSFATSDGKQTLTAIWIESQPPCIASFSKGSYESFTLARETRAY